MYTITILYDTHCISCWMMCCVTMVFSGVLHYGVLEGEWSVLGTNSHGSDGAAASNEQG